MFEGIFHSHRFLLLFRGNVFLGDFLLCYSNINKLLSPFIMVFVSVFSPSIMVYNMILYFPFMYVGKKIFIW